MSQVLFDYTKQDANGNGFVAQAWARATPDLTSPLHKQFKLRAQALLQQHDAVPAAHATSTPICRIRRCKPAGY